MHYKIEIKGSERDIFTPLQQAKKITEALKLEFLCVDFAIWDQEAYLSYDKYFSITVRPTSDVLDLYQIWEYKNKEELAKVKDEIKKKEKES